MDLIKPIVDSIDTLFAWFSVILKGTTGSYCSLETAEDKNILVASDGSLISVMKIEGLKYLVGSAEFTDLCTRINLVFQSTMKRSGHGFQFFFHYDKDNVVPELKETLASAVATAKRLNLDLNDLFKNRVKHLSKFCGSEKVYLVIWTRPYSLEKEQLKRSLKEKAVNIAEAKIPPLKNTQNILAGIKDIKDSHKSLVSSIVTDFNAMGLVTVLQEVHDAIRAIRMVADPSFTDLKWKPVLPGDKIPLRELEKGAGDIAEIMWPSLKNQILPRDSENLDLRTCRIGDKIYRSVFIDLFPQNVKSFSHLFRRILATSIPWRMSFFVDSGGLSSIKFKSIVATIISFASSENSLLSDSEKALSYLDLNSDEAIVKLRVSFSTWAPEDKKELLRIRASELALAVQRWGSCQTSEICGDPFAGAVSSMLCVTSNSVARTSVAPLSDVVYMLPFTRPTSPWVRGSVLFRSRDGKLMPYQPGSSKQTTWIDLFFALPGAGKSVLSNMINFALCTASGITRLPRIAIIDIGPSSSGLISLIREALPKDQQHLASYHRLQMTPEYAINPFDTQLGCRSPMSQERSFLVNFLTLLATPLGKTRAYDGVSDMAGLVVDELYKNFSDDFSPRVYTLGLEPIVDDILKEIGFVFDERTTWWEVTDALFVAGFSYEAMLSQRYAMPLLADAASMCRTQAISDLYGKVKTPTNETLVEAFNRMISSAVREYTILSRITKFDISDSRIVSLDLDDVAKSGGEAANRQTAVMYMIARYVLARDFYLTKDIINNISLQYRDYHGRRISEIREDSKRLVYDEFHRTAKTKAVRDQVIVDMREGRKWNVQIALISQSVDDFDDVMIEFATSIFIMAAGPEKTVKKISNMFGLSKTAETALKLYVHGPRKSGVSFLAQFSTKYGETTQLLTSTVGPVELWALSTTAEDVKVRNALYSELGPSITRKVLANLFPSGSVKSTIERRLELMKDTSGFIEEKAQMTVIDKLVEDIIESYKKNPNAKHI